MNQPKSWILTAAIGLLLGGCVSPPSNNAPGAAPPATSNSASGAAALSTGSRKEGEHETAHGGALNAIVKCEIGHAEVKREGDTLQLWFVGGAPDTTKSVPIPDRNVALKITAPDSKTLRMMILEPKPLDLAGETIGHCSHFEGKAGWLAHLDTFTATSQVTFKGVRQPLRIEFPHGFDPD